jgi:hypothetical protein
VLDNALHEIVHASQTIEQGKAGVAVEMDETVRQRRSCPEESWSPQALCYLTASSMPRNLGSLWQVYESLDYLPAEIHFYN